MINNAFVYILNSSNSPSPESFFSFVSDIFASGLNPTRTVILELGTAMIELSDLSLYQAKDYKLDLTRKYSKCIPLYLDFKSIPTLNSIYFLSKKFDTISGPDPFECEYVDVKESPVLSINLIQTNKSHSKYQIEWNGKIVERDLLVYLLEWIFVKA